MGTCLSKKKNSCTSSPVDGSKSVSTAPSQLKNSGNGVTVTHPEVNLNKENKLVQEKQDQLLAQEDESQVKKDIFIIKHRKSHDDNRERSSKIPTLTAQQNVPSQQIDGSASASSTSTNDGLASVESMGNNKIAPSTPNMGVVGLRTSSCTKEEVDAILIQCGRLSRSSSGRAASSSAAASGGRKYSGSKRSFDFDHCDNDTTSADDDQKRANAAATDNNNDLLCEEYDGVASEKRHHQHRQRHRQSPKGSSSSQGRRRTPSRERDQQQQRSSSRERRVSRSPGRRSSDTNANNNNTSSRPGKMVSVPPTVSSLVMDKSNNGVGVGESAASSGIKRISVKRNGGDGGVVGSRSAASPRSQSPARANGNGANAKVLSENQQPSLSRNNSSRKAEQSPYRRNPLSEIDPNSLAYPQSNTNNSSNKLQNRPKKETEAEANQKPNVDKNVNSKIRTGSRVALEKGVSVNCKAKEQQEEEIKVLSSVTDNVVVKTVVPSGVDNLKQPQTLTRSRSSRRSRDLDLNPEALLNPSQTYTSLLLEDIQNFHQKSTQQPSISLPACLTKACSILEAVADLNSTTTSSSPPTYETVRSNVPLSANHYGKRVPDNKDHPFMESEVVVRDDVMEPSLHKYVTVKRGGSLGGVDMEDQESSGSNSFTVVSNGQQHWGNVSSSSWEPNSADSKDCWTSRLNSREELEGSDMKTLNSKRRECDHQHSSGIGRGKLGSSNKALYTVPVVTAAAST